MAGSSSATEAVSAVGAVGSKGSSSSSDVDTITQMQNAYDIQQLELKAKNSKASETEQIENQWGFSVEETHKLYENLCNACVNQVKQDQEKMTQALSELKQSTEVSG